MTTLSPPIGAASRLDMVNVVSSEATKTNGYRGGRRRGLAYRTDLDLTAWVAERPDAHEVWIDLTVYDAQGRRCAGGRRLLRRGNAADGHGTLFRLSETVYRGTAVTPGSASPLPDARLLEFRLYYRTGERVFTDAVVHHHALLADHQVH